MSSPNSRGSLAASSMFHRAGSGPTRLLPPLASLTLLFHFFSMFWACTHSWFQPFSWFLLNHGFYFLVFFSVFALSPRKRYSEQANDCQSVRHGHQAWLRRDSGKASAQSRFSPEVFKLGSPMSSYGFKIIFPLSLNSCYITLLFGLTSVFTVVRDIGLPCHRCGNGGLGGWSNLPRIVLAGR